MYKERTKGTLRNLTFKYNQFLSEEMDKRKVNNNSEGEKIEKTSKRK